MSRDRRPRKFSRADIHSLSSTRNLCTAIMSRLIFPEWFRDASDIWDTRFCNAAVPVLRGCFQGQCHSYNGRVLIAASGVDRAL
ncbi:hypothetical protein B4914_08610 [Yersinia entomophaga]|nr:hypothetical protein B4914_08610 [Yersinia entomophaga]